MATEQLNDANDLVVDVLVPLTGGKDQAVCRQAIARKLGVNPTRICNFRLLKESIDSRQRTILYQLRFLVGLDTPLPPEPEYRMSYPPVQDNAQAVIIVGFGPAGMFAALRCLELGFKPIVLERGKNVSERRFDLASILRFGTVLEDSNYCFGEGGAGAFSDGKLFTRAGKRGPVRTVYETLVAHGAPKEILTDAHPHIGSNLLPNVVKAIRTTILHAGGEVHFQTKVVQLLRSDNKQQIQGVRCADGQEFLAQAVILATGHSARDIYRMLATENLRLEQKAFAVGVRIEHPQQFVDAHQYHLRSGQTRPAQLPAARYSVTTTLQDRGVHSFCMCPGGFIVPAATENDEVVVNGMSLSKRNSPFANAGFVVSVHPQDTQQFAKEHGALAGVAFQKAIEIATSRAGGGMQKAPAQHVPDFLAGKVSHSVAASSYHPGLTPYPLHELLPYFIVWRMREGLRLFDRKWHGFAGSHAQLIGCETRTSSPVRITRNPDTLEHPDLAGLYPCGEGAGFAGGIVSAALDGRRCVEALATRRGITL